MRPRTTEGGCLSGDRGVAYRHHRKVARQAREPIPPRLGCRLPVCIRLKRDRAPAGTAAGQRHQADQGALPARAGDVHACGAGGTLRSGSGRQCHLEGWRPVRGLANHRSRRFDNRPPTSSSSATFGWSYTRAGTRRNRWARAVRAARWPGGFSVFTGSPSTELTVSVGRFTRDAAPRKIAGR